MSCCKFGEIGPGIIHKPHMFSDFQSLLEGIHSIAFIHTSEVTETQSEKRDIGMEAVSYRHTVTV